MATPAGKVPIVESAKAGFDFMRANIAAIAPAAGAGALIYAGADLAGGGGGLSGLLLQVVGLVFGIVFSAFVLRLALRGDKSGALGLKLGKDEADLFGAAMVISFFMLIIAVMGGVVISVILTAAFERAGVSPEDLRGDPQAMQEQVAALLAGPSGPPLLGVLAVFAAALSYLFARLSLAAPATIGERRLMAFST
ncbi:MAG TPA: hypothetical protein VG983_01565, partial [Caulobacterales bacterium]|nr:hypothetical protein [Caulobacterales bacterium]